MRRGTNADKIYYMTRSNIQVELHGICSCLKFTVPVTWTFVEVLVYFLLLSRLKGLDELFSL